MRTDLDNCPPKNDLVDYLLGKLPETIVADFESHVGRCDLCEETIRGLAATDTLSELAFCAIKTSDSGTNLTLGPDPVVEKLICQINEKTSRLNAPDPVLIERAGEVLRRLSHSEKAESLGRLSNYEIQSLIGAGSTGIVFQAEDSTLKRTVALKVLLPSLGLAAKQRFISEAQAVASIDHPNVVTIYQVGEANELAFIAMQWVEGETLEDRLKKVTYIPEDQLKTIASQIASGLTAAHVSNLIHRDIKPANVWLAKESDNVKILDFGLARIADDDPHLTNTGMLAGTPNFMSPEQSRGLELDGRSDLFSLGCTMYRASTGKLPFGAGGVLATLQAIQSDHPAPPSDVNPAVSQDMSDLIMCLLDKQPANRPANASDLNLALKAKRSKWPFVVTNARPRVEEKINHHPASSSTWNWIAALMLIGLAAWGWTAFGQQIIRIATDQGQLVIETEEDDIQVEVVSGTDTIKIINTWAEQSINLKSGEYELRPKNKDDDTLSYSISKEKIVLNRGSRQVVSISILKTNVANSVDNKTQIATEPLYEGRTFAGWLETLKRERSKENIAKGLIALAELSDGNKTLQAQALNAMRPWIRKYGSSIVSNDKDWPTAFNRAFSKMPAELLVEFLIEELKNGNSASRGQLVWIATIGSLYINHNDLQMQQIRELRRHIKTIVDVGCEAIGSDPLNSKLIREVLEYSIGTAFSKIENGYYTGTREFTDDFHSYIHQKLLVAISENKSVLKTFLAQQILNAKNAELRSKGLQTILDSITDSDLPPDQLAKLYFVIAATPFPEDLDSEFASALQEVFGSAKLKSKLLDFSLSSGWPAYKLENNSNKNFTNLQKLESHIITRIGKQNSLIKASEEWLSKLSRKESIHSYQAKSLLKRIRPEPKKVAVKPPPKKRTTEFDPTLNYGPKTFLDTATRYLESNVKLDLHVAELTFRQLPHIARSHPELLPRVVKVAMTLLRRIPDSNSLISPKLDTGDSRHSASGYFRKHKTVQDIFSILNVSEPELVYELTLSEVSQGSQSSLVLLSLLFDHSIIGDNGDAFLYAGQREKLSKLISLFRKNLDLVLAQVFNRLKNDNSSNTYDYLKSFVTQVLEFTKESRYDSWDAKKFVYWVEFGPWLEQELQKSNDTIVNAFICTNLLPPVNRTFPVKKLGQTMIDERLPHAATVELFFATNSDFGSNFEQLIPYIVAFFKSDELVDRIVKKSEQFPSRETVRNYIFELFRSRKEHSKAVLPWLDEVASIGSIYSENARATAKSIRYYVDKSDTAVESEEMSTSDNDDSAPGRRELTFQGRNISSWTNIAETEVDERTLLDASLAIRVLLKKSNFGAVAAHDALLKILDETTFRNPILPYETIVTLKRIENLAPTNSKAADAVLKLVNEHELFKGKPKSTTQGGELVQDAIGYGAIEYFENIDDASAAMAIIKRYIVNGNEKSRLRLRLLVYSGNFLETLESRKDEFLQLMQSWSKAIESDEDSLAARRFCQLVFLKSMDEEVKTVAKKIRQQLLEAENAKASKNIETGSN